MTRLTRTPKPWEHSHLIDMATTLADEFIRRYPDLIASDENLSVIASEYHLEKLLGARRCPEVTNSRQSLR